MKQIWNRYRGILLCLLLLSSAVALLAVSGIGCPIKFLTGISCPGCGMTRALWSLVTLRLSAALHYHPLCLIMPPVAVFLTVFEIRRNRKAQEWVLWGTAVLLIAVYLWRMLSGGDEVVTWAPREGWIIRTVSRILTALGYGG